MLAVAISGSPRSPSKSRALAESLLHALAELRCDTRIIDLAVLPAEALVARAPARECDDAITAVGDARIVIAATPTYRALYTGVLKSFFDLMPQAHLRGKICVPLQTAASPAHLLAVEHGLQPLFASLDGIAVPGMYVTDSEFEDGVPSADLTERLHQLAQRTVALARAIGN